MNKEEINKLLKDNPIKIIKFDDIEVPVEWLKQSTVNINGDDYIKLQQENKQLKEQLLVAQTNEETFRLEMEDITRALGLDEDTIFDDVKAYVRSLKDNWNKLKEYFNERIEVCDNRLSSPFCNFEKATKERLIFTQCLEKLEELEQGSDK